MAIAYIQKIHDNVRLPFETDAGECEDGADDRHVLHVVDELAHSFAERPAECKPLGELQDKHRHESFSHRIVGSALHLMQKGDRGILDSILLLVSCRSHFTTRPL